DLFFNNFIHLLSSLSNTIAFPGSKISPYLKNGSVILFINLLILLNIYKEPFHYLKIRLPSIHTQSFKYRIHRIHIEVGLEVDKQFHRNHWDICRTTHWQSNLLGTRIKSHLKTLSNTFHRCHRTTQAHITQYHHLTLYRSS